MAAPASLGATLDNWLANVTQSFGVNGEHGIDVGLPYNTPVYAPTGGTVLASGYDPQIGGVISWRSLINYGGINGPASLYIQHLNTVLVSAGQQIQPGQLIGYSGGQLGYGNHPNTRNVSTGPHIEFGINSPPQGNVNLWRAIGPNVNPRGFLSALAAGDQSVATSSNTSNSGTGGGSGSSGGGGFFGGLIPSLPPALSGALFGATGAAAQNAAPSITDIPGAIGAATGTVLSAGEQALKRGAFFVLALVIVLTGVWLLVEPAVADKTEQATRVAAEVGAA